MATFTFDPSNGTAQFQMEHNRVEYQKAYAAWNTLKTEVDRERLVQSADDDAIAKHPTVRYYTTLAKNADVNYSDSIRALNDKFTAFRDNRLSTIEGLGAERDAKVQTIRDNYRAQIEALEREMQTKIKRWSDTFQAKIDAVEKEIAAKQRKIESEKEQEQQKHTASVEKLQNQINDKKESLMTPSGVAFKRKVAKLAEAEQKLAYYTAALSTLAPYYEKEVATISKEREQQEAFEAALAAKTAKEEGDRLWAERVAKEQEEYEARAAKRQEVEVEQGEGKNVGEAKNSQKNPKFSGKTEPPIVFPQPASQPQPLEVAKEDATPSFKFATLEECEAAYEDTSSTDPAFAAIEAELNERYRLIKSGKEVVEQPPVEVAKPIVAKVKVQPKQYVKRKEPEPPKETLEEYEARMYAEEMKKLEEANARGAASCRVRFEKELLKVSGGNSARVTQALNEILDNDAPRVISSTRVKPAPGQRFRL